MNKLEVLDEINYPLADAARILNVTETVLLQAAQHSASQYGGLKLMVSVVDDVLDDDENWHSRFSIHCALDTIEIASICANNKVEISAYTLLARVRGVMAPTMDDEMFQRMPIGERSYSYKFHPKNPNVTITKERVLIDGRWLNEQRARAESGRQRAKSQKFESLCLALESYFESALTALPESLRNWVNRAYLQRPFGQGLWEELKSSERRQSAIEWDARHSPHGEPEQRRGWWDYTMDASAWWQAESVTPIHAAMLLSRWNPNTEKVEDAEVSSSDEMGPEDFRRLKNIFEGASREARRTLKDWAEYARARGLKIHSWICDWETLINECDASQSLTSIAKDKFISIKGALELLATQKRMSVASVANWLNKEGAGDESKLNLYFLLPDDDSTRRAAPHLGNYQASQAALDALAHKNITLEWEQIYGKFGWLHSDLADFLKSKGIDVSALEAKSNKPNTEFVENFPGQESDKGELIKPVPRFAAQEKAIRDALQNRGLDPLKLPKPEAGKAGVKANIRKDLLKNRKDAFVSQGVFDDAWQRMRDKGDLAEIDVPG